MMDSKCYFKMKAAGIDVSSLANIFEENANFERETYAKLNETKMQEQHKEYKELAAPKPEPGSLADILSGGCSNDPELLKDAPGTECPGSFEADYMPEDIEAYKQRLSEAIRNMEAGVSRNPPHHIVLLSDEPDAIPIPYSSVLHGKDIGLKQRFSGTHTGKRGSNYTPPKKKRKKR